MRLGKKPATAPRSKHLRFYLRIPLSAQQLPPVPASMDRSGDVPSWPMLDNDQIGDCTIAAVGHAVQLWTAAAGLPVGGLPVGGAPGSPRTRSRGAPPRVMSSAEAVRGYEAFGYQPGNPETDQGANAQDVLTRWTGPGFECGGAMDVLTGFCALGIERTVRCRDDFEVKAGVAWLGVVYAGLALPLAVQGAAAWDTGPLSTPADGPWAPGSWGGHAVPIVGYDASGLTVVTWGKRLAMTWAFWRTYADEAYGLLSRDFVSVAIPDEGWAELEQEMADLRSAK